MGRVGTTSGCITSHPGSPASLCYEPELIPDPDGLARCLAKTYALLAGSGISNNEKNQRSAASLYIAPGFAHMRSIVSAYGLI